MGEGFSGDFKKYFLLTFTKELILHSEKREIVNLQKIIKLKEEKPIQQIQIKEFIEKPIIQFNNYPLSIPHQRKIISQRLFPEKQMRPQIRTSQVSIPEPKLPEHLEYLKPIPRGTIEIDLFKINPLIKDPAVKIIEANPDKGIIVTGTMGTKPTNIILNKEDIDRIINKFSEFSKIPRSEGIYKVVAGNLILSAVISEVIGSRFVIRKMAIPQEPPSPQKNNLRIR